IPARADRMAWLTAATAWCWPITLARTQKANPLLLGEPGVGKTAIVEGLAWRIAQGKVPEIMKGKRLIQLDMGELTADTELRGQFERRVKQIIKEACEAPDVILFIDEIHTLVGAGESMHSALDAAQMFKPALAHGDFSCIGATTQNEYFRYIRRDPALERRFSPVIIKELGPEVNLTILEKAAERILDKQAQAGYRLTLAPDVLITALRLTDQYIRDRNQPDKSIDVIDLACAKDIVKSDNMVTAEDIAAVVSEWTGIPVSRMTSDEKERYAQMEEVLNARVIGQHQAVAAVSQAIRSALAGMKALHRPIGVFLFLGPTGVGKTKLAKELANFLFQSPQALLRFDMNEYKESHTISNLIGSSRGYVGSEQGGLLCEALRKRPYSVVLLDEIDKAHPEILDLFLSIFDDGRLTDNQGRQVDCSNALFIMTSNYGIAGGRMGFEFSGAIDLDVKAAVHKSEDMRKKALEFLRPELVNRITEVIEFPLLQRDDFKAILDLILQERIAEFGVAQQMPIELKVHDSAKELILDLGYDSKMGARSLERAVDQVLIHPLVDVIYNDKNNDTALIAVAKDNRMVFLTEEEFDNEKENYMGSIAVDEAEGDREGTEPGNRFKLELPNGLESYREKFEQSVKPFIKITTRRGGNPPLGE
ncbi:MAG TPA: ATP-dependent Clp protease ATP-binding subunit, partial [Bacillota bacterium]|nr:ATP-dependent Clp protease ATP-binding subunit [Bacillota bacterium]